MMDSLRNVTEPSAMRKLHPPGWLLRKLLAEFWPVIVVTPGRLSAQALAGFGLLSWEVSIYESVTGFLFMGSTVAANKLVNGPIFAIYAVLFGCPAIQGNQEKELSPKGSVAGVTQ